jgi:hypothetical protein
MAERTDEEELEDRLDDSGAAGGDVDLSDLETDVDGAGGGDVGFDESELGVDVDSLTGDPSASTGGNDAAAERTASGAAEADTDDGPGLLSRLRPSVGLGGTGDLTNGLTTRSFVVSLVVTVVFMLGVGGVVPLPGAGLLGVFLGAFLLGLVSGKRRYLFLVLSGGLAAGLNALFGSLTLAFLAGLAAPLAALGAGGGALAAVLGHYFGRDLRAGLTRDM